MFLPVWLANVPPGHGMQEDMAVLGAYCPTGQLLQEGWPPEETVPGEQGVQMLLLELGAVPDAQDWQGCLPPMLTWPALQALQPEPGLLGCEPAGHCVGCRLCRRCGSRTSSSSPGRSLI